MKALVKSLAGLALVLGWWTLTGDGDDPSHETADRIPALVWEGGGAELAIEADTTTPAHMRVSFSERGESGEQRWLETWEAVEAGHHRWSIEVPEGVGGTVELGAVDPQPGDELRWTLRVDGEAVDEQAETLEQPLEEGYAFFLQTYFDDYAAGTLGDD
jgi:hypothetical protein